MQAAVASEIQQNSNIQIASLDINCLVTVADFIWAASKPSAQNESSLLKLSMQVGISVLWLEKEQCEGNWSHCFRKHFSN